MLVIGFITASAWAVAAGVLIEHPPPLYSIHLHPRPKNRTQAKAERYHRLHRSLASPPESAPLFPGMGTHYAFVYAGTPPQRQSVIIDTGSHYTAFPCKGCTTCGQHTDPYYDPELSSTESIPNCNGGKCTFSQAYAEGSSWHAYKVIDKLWVGGENPEEVERGDHYVVDYTFGCQTSETGLFKSQLENGIMGMNMGSDSFPSQLKNKGITSSTVFGLCLSFTGGVITLGGIEASLHLPSAEVNYVKMHNQRNWYGVHISDMRLKESTGAERRFIDKDTIASSCSEGSMGTIVDSGTTDTYLPSSLKSSFASSFKSITGITYLSGKSISLTDSQLESLPDVVFELDKAGGGSTVVNMPWYNYVAEVDDNGKYEFTIFFDERSGGILGANFMAG